MPFPFFFAALAAVGTAKVLSSVLSGKSSSSSSSVSSGANVVQEQDLGFEPIPVIKPSFVAFKFTGLRPNTPHWVFFDNTMVNEFVNTSYGIDDMLEGANKETFTNPGDQFLDATGFPSSLGGPTTGPFNTTAAGELEGMLYIQSNETTKYSTGTRIITVIDVSALNKANSLSYGEAQVVFDGQQELYETISSPPPIDTYEPDNPSNDNGGANQGSNSSNDDDDDPPKITSTDNPDGTTSINFTYSYGTVTHIHDASGTMIGGTKTYGGVTKPMSQGGPGWWS